MSSDTGTEPTSALVERGEAWSAGVLGPGDGRGMSERRIRDCAVPRPHGFGATGPRPLCVAPVWGPTARTAVGGLLDSGKHVGVT